MAPLLPAMLKLEDAVKMTAVALQISQGFALDRMLDGLCDGAIYADAIFRSAAGPPNRLAISPANWQMHKYNGAKLHYDIVEVATADLLLWLRLDERQNKALEEALANSAPLVLTRDRVLIRGCVRSVYKSATEQSVKPPNINELPECVNQVLAPLSCRAPNDLVKEIGQEPDLARYRPTQGQRPKASLKPLSELDLSKAKPLKG